MAKVSRQQGATVVALDRTYDALDPPSIEGLSQVLLGEAERIDPPWLVLDFTNTEYISSTALEVIVHAWKRLSTREGRMALCNLNDFCAEVLHITRLDHIWHVAATRDEAVAWVAAPA
jgi:anti-anti-sigma factor